MLIWNVLYFTRIISDSFNIVLGREWLKRYETTASNRVIMRTVGQFVMLRACFPGYLETCPGLQEREKFTAHKSETYFLQPLIYSPSVFNIRITWLTIFTRPNLQRFWRIRTQSFACEPGHSYDVPSVFFQLHKCRWWPRAVDSYRLKWLISVSWNVGNTVSLENTISVMWWNVFPFHEQRGGAFVETGYVSRVGVRSYRKKRNHQPAQTLDRKDWIILQTLLLLVPRSDVASSFSKTTKKCNSFRVRLSVHQLKQRPFSFVAIQLSIGQ